MTCFYSNSGSVEQKPQKREPREVISRKLIMIKLITDSLGCCIYFLFDKTEEMSPFVSFNLNTGISFLPYLFFLAGNLMVASIK